MAPFCQLDSKADFDSHIRAARGKTVLVAFWPGDTLSNAVMAAIQAQLPPTTYARYGVVDVYCFDGYALPELATELDVTFVPTLMWFVDGVMDAVVWHQGCSARGENVAKGVERVVARIKGAEIGEDHDDDDDW